MSIENKLPNLKNRSIELFNSLLSKLNKDHHRLLFEYEEVLTAIQLIENKVLDDNLDDIRLIKSN